MLTLTDLDMLERCADPIDLSAGAQRVKGSAIFERAAAPYRTLVRKARLILLRGQHINAELEQELRQGARALLLFLAKHGLLGSP